MAENVKVIVRCRPMNAKEKELQSKPVVKMKDCMVEIFDPAEGPAFPKQFTFDSVYDVDSQTENIYNDICYPLVESVLEGYNSTIFVYGQTGCGKSYSMEGNKTSNPPEKGIISRTFEHIFEAISVATETKYLAIVSYLEIYNEQIRDLLTFDGSKTAANSNNLPLKDTQNEGLTVAGLTTHQVHNMQECEELLQIGAKNRMIGATLMNQNSSRSHSIFTISIEQINNCNDTETIRRGKLNLVDLAGSERQAKTGATGERLKEATKINLSLSALGNVISALVDGKAKHIPYRDSKLTRLLQDSLGGNTRTLMIACISPASRNYVETLSTLRYANRAKNISNKPKVNEDPKDAILRQYQEEIERLKDMLNKSVRLSTPLKIEDVDEESTIISDNKKINMNHLNIHNNNNTQDDLDQKRDFLIQQYESEMEKLKNLHQDEKAQKENIMKQIETIREEYNQSIEKLNDEIKSQQEINASNKPETVNKEEILQRIELLKANMIGGERANDKELSERRRKKKIASERRLSAIAHVLAKMDLNEDREILQNQYKDIAQELNLKTDALRRFRHRVKSLEKEIQDIQGEFETERQDYLETIRKQDMSVKLMTQISDKMSGSMKKECNYRDLESIKEQAVWSDDSQKYRLPELIFKRTKFPPAGNQRVSSSNSENSSAPTSPPDYSLTNGSGNGNGYINGHGERFEKMDDDIVGSYFKPKRATQLLNQSVRQTMNTNQIFNTWREVPVTDFATTRRHQQPSGQSAYHNGHNHNLNGPNLTSTQNGNDHSPWHRSPRKQSTTNGHFLSDSNLRRPLRLEALPTIEKGRHS
ncbi:osmotic avoidance abnormal protein 3 isoform X2 [Atheta coriaria]|uniref:osmotic avoidance abnormal protein 3 isoform X2 n=1 Tax=Dalotia coriaria TaxID=877792 RepID=UPI0031F3BC44